MKTEDINTQITDALLHATNIKNTLYNIVWENQEGQSDHFDNLPKAQRVALIGLLNNAVNLVQSLSMYESWFINTK